MSSLLAHVAAGLTLYFCRKDQLPRLHAGMALPVLLAIAPDFDYFGIWFFHLRYEQRFTHSLLFCLMISATASYLVRRMGRQSPALPGFWILLLAACSHLLLDLLAGRFLPLLWPFVPTGFSLSMVLLPGAAHTGLVSYAFWRNLIVEFCLLLPLLMAMVMLLRRLPVRSYMPEILLVLTMWSGLVFAGGRLAAI